jgi:serine/threonine protein phosphatase PrpC
MRGKMDCYGLTDIGTVRAVNEDQFLVADLNKSLLIHHTSLSLEDHTRLFGGSQGKLLLVADGLGAADDGKRASALTVETVAHYVLNTMPWFLRLQERADQEADLHEELKGALEECQNRVEAAAATAAERRKMGTTLTMAYLLWPRLYVVHAGDSRCYLLRQGRLEQVTTDHTVAQQLVERGALAPEEVEDSRWSHVLWNCIGGGSHELNPDVYQLTLQVGDSLLLCTDGLTKALADEQLREVLGRRTGAEQTCRELIGLANGRGGTDNVTAVVAHFRPPEEVMAPTQAVMAAEPGSGPAEELADFAATTGVATAEIGS